MRAHLNPFLRLSAGLLAILLGSAWLAVSGAFQYLEPDLPDVSALSDVRLQIPLRIYSRDGRLIAPPIGEQRRIPLRYEEFPQLLINAVLAAEDAQFFSHRGVDYRGLLRSMLHNFVSRDRGQGGGTITMQLTRGVFLSPEKTYRRKLTEIFLTLRIERLFSKQEILALYLNKMFLGQRAYGAGAAAEVYFGKTVDKLSLPEIAVIAGTFRLPSRENPVANPEYARQRRAYVLRRMHENDFISKEELDSAAATPVESKLHDPTIDVDASYAAELVRAEMLTRFGSGAYTDGYRVITSIDSRHQQAAVRAVRMGLIEYDRRHGYRGAVARLQLDPASDDARRAALLADYPAPSDLNSALVVGISPQSVDALMRDGQHIAIPFANLSWAKPALADGNTGRAPERPSDVVSLGDVIYVGQDVAGSWHLVQAPQAQSALVAIDARDGAITALVGGYDYYSSNFNRAVHAKRQPGSSFKPLLYSSALEHGFTAASIVNDSPFTSYDAEQEKLWRPENDSRSFLGPMRLREALIKSRNLVSIRVMDALGPEYVAEYAQRFGLTPEELPPYPSLALGATQVSPLTMARAYAVFANGGFLVDPYFIDRIEDADGRIVYQASPKIACPDCMDGAAKSGGSEMLTGDLARWGASPYANTPAESSRLAPMTITPQNAYVMTDMMADVTRRGTASKAAALKRNDIAGKTGTSNDGRDNWFCGFNGDLSATVWVGFDQERSLGANEQGSRTALPIWMKFMGEALRGQPEHRQPRPLGLIDMRVSATTGKIAHPGDSNTVLEVFIDGRLPDADAGSARGEDHQEKTEDSLF